MRAYRLVFEHQSRYNSETVHEFGSVMAIGSRVGANGSDTRAHRQETEDPMIPGEILAQEGDITLNADAPVTELEVSNTGDRPVQVGSHYHFAETNAALSFDRMAARGQRLDIAAGTAVRFEPGQTRMVSLVPLGGDRVVYGFNQAVMGAL